MNGEEFAISVGDVTDMEATVCVRYLIGNAAGVQLVGTLRGPYCAGSRTLPAEFAFHDVEPERPGEAVAVVTDPCMWSEEMPHLYHVDIEARRGAETLAVYHDKIALRRLAPRRPVDFAPGTG